MTSSLLSMQLERLLLVNECRFCWMMCLREGLLASFMFYCKNSDLLLECVVPLFLVIWYYLNSVYVWSFVISVFKVLHINEVATKPQYYVFIIIIYWIIHELSFQTLNCRTVVSVQKIVFRPKYISCTHIQAYTFLYNIR